MITPPSGSKRATNYPLNKIEFDGKSRDSSLTLSSTSKGAQRIKDDIQSEERKNSIKTLEKKIEATSEDLKKKIRVCNNISNLNRFSQKQKINDNNKNFLAFTTLRKEINSESLLKLVKRPLLVEIDNAEKEVLKIFTEKESELKSFDRNLEKLSSPMANLNLEATQDTFAVAAKKYKETAQKLIEEVKSCSSFDTFCAVVQKEKLRINNDVITHSAYDERFFSGRITKKNKRLRTEINYLNKQLIRALENKLRGVCFVSEVNLEKFLSLQNESDQGLRDKKNSCLKRLSDLKIYISRLPEFCSLNKELEKVLSLVLVIEEEEKFSEDTKNFFKKYYHSLKSSEEGNRFWLQSFFMAEDVALQCITPAKLKEVLLDASYTSEESLGEKFDLCRAVFNSQNTKLKRHAREYMTDFMSQFDEEKQKEIEKLIATKSS